MEDSGETMKKRTRKLLASEIVMIDPMDCGSTIGYVIRESRYGLSAEMALSDCNRKIEWYFSRSESNSAVAKIDRAIAVMNNFRAAFIKAKGKRK